MIITTEKEAQRKADALAARMGPRWTTIVWENLGWHYRAVKGSTTIHEYDFGDKMTYSAWIEPDLVISNTQFQIIEYADTPEDALGIAKQKAWAAISMIRQAMNELDEEMRDLEYMA